MQRTGKWEIERARRRRCHSDDRKGPGTTSDGYDGTARAVRPRDGTRVRRHDRTSTRTAAGRRWATGASRAGPVLTDATADVSHEVEIVVITVGATPSARAATDRWMAARAGPSRRSSRRQLTLRRPRRGGRLLRDRDRGTPTQGRSSPGRVGVDGTPNSAGDGEHGRRASRRARSADGRAASRLSTASHAERRPGRALSWTCSAPTLDTDG